MRKVLLLAVFSLVSVALPARAQFCPGAAPWVFDDVSSADPFCGYITWAAQHGITLGCAVIDANHRLYCPNDAVTRSQMAAFVNRLGNVRVEAVGTGPGLTGGPITGIGTINLAATNLLPTVACANNQIARWNGSAWACSTDANSGGTVTSVGSGAGLSGGPITTSGTLSIATGFQLPQGCTNGQVAKSNGSNAWTCANDVNGGGTVTSITAGNGLTGGTITTSGTIAVDPASTTLTGSFFRQNGNAFGASAVLGTADDNALDIRVNGSRVMRYEPNAISPNVIGGSPANSVTAGVRGATIAGGGVPSGDTDPTFSSEAPNRVTDAYGTVGGGYANVAGNGDATTTNASFATVAGGRSNTANGPISTVGGGQGNVALGTGSVVAGGTGSFAGSEAAVCGGTSNTASGSLSFVGGGYSNTADGSGSTIGGGFSNSATGFRSTIAGGNNNDALGDYSTVVGGHLNSAAGDYSVALGRRAKSTGDGSFHFADNNDFDFGVGTANVFRVRATGGVRFVVDIDGTGGTTWSCLLTSGNAWSCSSDRALKQGLAELDGRDVLEKLAAMPVYQWQPRGANAHVRHYGPMAQDFHAAFGLGDDDKMIGFQDADGVALAAIKGLNAKLEATVAEQAREIAQLKASNAQEMAEMRRAVDVLMARTSPEGRVAAK